MIIIPFFPSTSRDKKLILRGAQKLPNSQRVSIVSRTLSSHSVAFAIRPRAARCVIFFRIVVVAFTLLTVAVLL